MPAIKYLPAPPSPVRKLPKGVGMSQVEPSPWACIKCRKRAITYADGVVWCNKCEKKLLDHEKVDVSRGKQRNTPSPSWGRIKA